MLFDLRGAGRRRTVKVVYITLAFLMGGGLVLFGIGGDVSGGLVDAITERGGGDDGSDRFRKQETAALKRTDANPQDAAAWAALARARFQIAGIGENFDPEKATFTKTGRAKLVAAEEAWDRYLALEPAEARRPGREPDGPGVRRAQQARQGGAGPGGHHRRSPDGLDLHPARDLRLPGGPDPQGRSRQGQGARAHRPGHARGPEGSARARPSRPPPRPRRSPAPPRSFVLHFAARPCSSTGRAADS